MQRQNTRSPHIGLCEDLVWENEILEVDYGKIIESRGRRPRLSFPRRRRRKKSPCKYDNIQRFDLLDYYPTLTLRFPAYVFRSLVSFTGWTDLNSLPFGFFRSRIDSTPIGSIEVSATPAGITSVNLLGRFPSNSELIGNVSDESELTRIALQQILEYLAGRRRVFDLPLDLTAPGSFQEKVLAMTAEIPFGKIMTYGQIASEITSVSASRAVGGALARNPIPIIIPCHRVVAANGRLTGYSAVEGIKTKQWLLELEGHKIVGEKLV